MRRKVKDLTGQRFGRLVVIKEVGKHKRSGNLWLCKCDCGGETTILSCSLKSGNTKSCGCLLKDDSLAKFKRLHEREWVEGTSLININQKMSTTNTSGTKGVSWYKKRNKWVAYITFKRNRVNLGYYENLQDAINARKEAEEKYFKPILEKYGKLSE